VTISSFWEGTKTKRVFFTQLSLHFKPVNKENLSFSPSHTPQKKRSTARAARHENEIYQSSSTLRTVRPVLQYRHRDALQQVTVNVFQGVVLRCRILPLFLAACPHSGDS
jgi:hypothetical protein